MGQYYFPVEKESKEHLYSHDYKSGLKLMEHSWLKNPMMRAVESLLIPGGRWHKKPIVWAGDYANKEEGSAENLHSLASNGGEEGENIINKLKPKPLTEAQSKKFRFIVNHTTKQFVDKRNLITNDGWTIHPLSLLTAEGNGLGGGDYIGNDPKELIGSWSRNIISIEEKAPEGFSELVFDLLED